MFKGYKTLAVSAALAIVGLLQQNNVVEIIPDHYQGIFVAGVGLVMAVLRYYTDTKVLSKD